MREGICVCCSLNIFSHFKAKIYMYEKLTVNIRKFNGF